MSKSVPQLTARTSILGNDLFHIVRGNVDFKITWTDISNSITAGSGTLNRVAKWTPSGTELGDSQIFDNGTNVGVNIFTGLSAKLHVKGAGNTSATNGLIVENSSGAQSLVVRDDGSVYNLGLGSNIRNTAFGLGAGTSITTADYSTLVGVGAGKSITTGGLNSGFGYDVLIAATGTQNSAFGVQASSLNGSGNNNSSFGMNALYSNIVSSNNCAFGFEALYLSTTAQNSAFGVASFRQNATGYENVGMGYNSFYLNTSGIQNVGIGNFTGGSNLTGSRNVFIGYYAGAYETSSDTLYIHNNLGTSDLATGKSNSLIYGVFNATPANQRLTINAPIRCHNFTATQASSISPLDGDIIYVTDTNGTFTSIGFWGYENGSWVKL